MADLLGVFAEALDIPVFKVDPTVAERQFAKLKAVREKRDAAAVKKSLARLRADCASGANVMPSVLECVKAYVTIGEIGQVWREVFGEYVPETLRL